MAVAGSDVLLHGPDEPAPTRSGYNADNTLLTALLEGRQAVSEVHGVLFAPSTFVAPPVDIGRL